MHNFNTIKITEWKYFEHVVYSTFYNIKCKVHKIHCHKYQLLKIIDSRLIFQPHFLAHRDCVAMNLLN